MKKHYVYVLLDPRDTNHFTFKNIQLKGKPFYVGVGKGERVLTHFSNYSKNKGSNKNKNLIIKELLNEGYEKPFQILFDNLSQKQGNDIEKELIQYFGRLCDGGILTNIRKGGDISVLNVVGSGNINSKRVYQYSLDGFFIREWESLRGIGDVFNDIHYNTIGDACRANQNKNTFFSKAGDFMWFFSFKGEKIQKYEYNTEHTKKKVYVYDIFNCKLVSIYPSLKECTSYFKLDYNAVSVKIKKEQRVLNYIFSYKKLTSCDIIEIRNKYDYYIVDEVNYFFNLKEVSIYTNESHTKLKYLKSVNKLSNNIVFVRRARALGLTVLQVEYGNF